MEAKEIFEKVKPAFTEQEQELINLLYEIEDKSPKTIEEFQNKYNLSYGQVRDILRNALNTHKDEIKQIQMVVGKCVKESIEIKENDVLDLEMSVYYPDEDEDEDENKERICRLGITYIHNGEYFSDFSYDIPEDALYSDIYDYIDQCLNEDTDISDYEILETKYTDDTSQTAKIKAKRIDIVMSKITYLF